MASSAGPRELCQCWRLFLLLGVDWPGARGTAIQPSFCASFPAHFIIIDNKLDPALKFGASGPGWRASAWMRSDHMDPSGFFKNCVFDQANRANLILPDSIVGFGREVNLTISSRPIERGDDSAGVPQLTFSARGMGKGANNSDA